MTDRPVQNVISGESRSWESCSIKYQGFSSGNLKVLPTMGHGSGPGGCQAISDRCSELPRFKGIVTIRHLNYSMRA
jgi:hypothetical protein